MTGIDLLRAMDESHPWSLFAHDMPCVDDIPHLRNPLFLSRERDDCRVGEHEHTVEVGNLSQSQLGEHIAFRQHTVLLVQHGTQQIVGVYAPLHQHVGIALADNLHGTAGGIVGVVGIHIADVAVVVLHSLVAADDVVSANERHVYKSFVECHLDSTLRVFVDSVDYSQALPCAPAGKQFYQVFKGHHFKGKKVKKLYEYPLLSKWTIVEKLFLFLFFFLYSLVGFDFLLFLAGFLAGLVAGLLLGKLLVFRAVTVADERVDDIPHDEYSQCYK